MIKGVNKKIIEINDTKNIYFEKAILYVRPEMLDTPPGHLMKEASYYLEENTPLSSTSRAERRLSSLSRILAAIASIGVIGTVIVFFIIGG
ncbi:MAG: hypothetical protein E7505_02830 [Ruminococcus sp.]|jgi:hypothetical protein|nr:hypothetical protein [Ruminococcus sp.]